jgi:molybdopterin converting factor small subunit
MARVKLNAYATLRAYLGGAASKETEIEPGQTVGELLDRMGIPRDQTRIVFVNSRAASLADRLQGGEHVGVFPAIGGG